MHSVGKKKMMRTNKRKQPFSSIFVIVSLIAVVPLSSGFVIPQRRHCPTTRTLSSSVVIRTTTTTTTTTTRIINTNSNNKKSSTDGLSLLLLLAKNTNNDNDDDDDDDDDVDFLFRSSWNDVTNIKSSSRSSCRRSGALNDLSTSTTTTTTTSTTNSSAFIRDMVVTATTIVIMTAAITSLLPLPAMAATTTATSAAATSTAAAATAASSASFYNTLASAGHSFGILGAAVILMYERLTIQPFMDEFEEEQLAFANQGYMLMGFLMMQSGFILLQQPQGLHSPLSSTTAASAAAAATATAKATAALSTSSLWEFYSHQPLFWLKLLLVAIWFSSSVFTSTTLTRRSLARSLGRDIFVAPMGEQLTNRMIQSCNVQLAALFLLPLVGTGMSMYEQMSDFNIPVAVEVTTVLLIFLGFTTKNIQEALRFEEEEGNQPIMMYSSRSPGGRYYNNNNNMNRMPTDFPDSYLLPMYPSSNDRRTRARATNQQQQQRWTPRFVPRNLRDARPQTDAVMTQFPPPPRSAANNRGGSKRSNINRQDQQPQMGPTAPQYRNDFVQKKKLKDIVNGGGGVDSDDDYYYYDDNDNGNGNDIPPNKRKQNFDGLMKVFPEGDINGDYIDVTRLQ